MLDLIISDKLCSFRSVHDNLDVLDAGGSRDIDMHPRHVDGRQL